MRRTMAWTALLLWTTFLVPTVHAQGLRVIEFIVTPRFTTSTTTSTTPFVCDALTALATQAAAEDCVAAVGASACASDAMATVDVTYAECTDATNSILVRGGVVQAGVSTLQALETDACLRTTLASASCVPYFQNALGPTLASVVLTTTPSTTSMGSQTSAPTQTTPPPVKVPDATAAPVAQTTFPRTIAPVLSPSGAPVTVAPTLTGSATLFPTVAPTSLVVAAPTAAPSRVVGETPVPTLETDVPSVGVPPSVVPIAEGSPFPTPIDESARTTAAPVRDSVTTLAPVRAAAPNATGINNGAASAQTPIVDDPNDPNRGIAVERDNRTLLYKGIVSGFAGVVGLGLLAYAVLWFKKKKKQSAEPKDVVVLGASAVAVDTTYNTLSEHDDIMDTLERGDTKFGTRAASARVVTPSPKHDTESRRSGSNQQSAATSSIDAASTILDHFGAAVEDDAPPPPRRRRPSSAAGGSSIPEHDELSSTCSSFDLNDSDGEESSMYESEGGDDTLTLDDADFDLAQQPAFDAVTGARTRPYPKAHSEVSSLSSAQFETGTMAMDDEPPSSHRPTMETTPSSRQFMDWLHKSPLIPAAAKASSRDPPTVDPPPRSVPATTPPTTVVATRPSGSTRPSGTSSHSRRSGTSSK